MPPYNKKITSKNIKQSEIKIVTGEFSLNKGSVENEFNNKMY
jgi:hypothetical protein